MSQIIKAVKHPRKAFRVIFSTMINVLKFKRKGVVFKECPHFDGLIIVSKSKGATIRIGEDVYMNSGRKCNPVGFEHRMMISAAGDGAIEIGNHVGMSNTVLYSTNSIIIEDGVLLGNGVKIYDTDFHSMDITKRSSGHSDDDTRTLPVLICNNAFVGAGTTILKGVTIGANSVIGACSVVAKNIPENQVWAGNPARFIRNI